MSTVATPMAEKSEYCKYITVKLDSEVQPLVKAAAVLDGTTLQEWLSNLANDGASKALGRKPIKRKPPQPKP